MIGCKDDDLVVGLCMHMELVPMPAPTPTPLPHPFLATVGDPSRKAAKAVGQPMAAASGDEKLDERPVTINGALTTNVATITKNATALPHIPLPPGTGWAPTPKPPKPKVGILETPPPPAGPDLRTRAGAPAGAALVLTIASTEAYKDHPTLIDAAGLLFDRLPGAWWVVLGTGGLFEETVARAERRGFADRLWHLTLPALALALSVMAIVVKITRASMIEELDKAYVAFAVARPSRRQTSSDATGGRVYIDAPVSSRAQSKKEGGR